MSNTALVFLAVYAMGLVLALVKDPRYGLGAYMWAFYLNPPDRWWGAELPGVRWSLVAAAVCLVALAVQKLRAPIAPPPVVSVRSTFGRPSGPSGSTPSEPAHATAPGADGVLPAPLPTRVDSWGFRLLLAFTGWMWLQWLWAVNPPTHIEGCILYTKFVVLYYVLVKTIRDGKTLELFAWAHVLGCFYWGWLAYVSEVAGRLELTLGPGVGDANFIGFHLVTGLAFAGLMLIGMRGVRRWMTLGAIPFILNGVILTASRSALVGLIAAGMATLWFGPRARRGALILAAALGMVLFLRLAGSDLFWQRAQTIVVSEAEERDTSAELRLITAQANWEMVKDHPLGVGHRGNDAISSQYLPREALDRHGVRSAHSTILAVLADHGFPGGLLLLGLYLWIGVQLLRLRSVDRTAPLANFGMYRGAVAGTMAAFVVCGLFINLIRSEVAIWVTALVVVLHHLARYPHLLGDVEKLADGTSPAVAPPRAVPSFTALRSGRPAATEATSPATRHQFLRSQGP